MVKEETKTKPKRSCYRIPEDVKLKIAKERHLEGKSTVEIAKEYGLRAYASTSKAFDCAGH